jgi:radical SAM superfamily enzyme YgiQ (UPF0313 family)
MGAPPLGPAALLAYLRANGCDAFDFLDLRLWAPNAYAPTYRHSGVFGETYILDVPDLPLILSLLENFTHSRALAPSPDSLFDRYCLERGISAEFLHAYLQSTERLLHSSFSQLPHLKFVGFTVWSSNLLTTLMAAALLKRRQQPPLIVLGGPQVTESQSSAKLALQTGLADFVVLGEGEETLLQLFEAFQKEGGIPTQTVPGTMRFNRSSGQFDRSERPLLRLATLPLPAFDQMALPSYWTKASGMRTVTYELSRGCTDKCSFCSEWVFWKRMRVGSLQNTISGVEDLSSRFGAERIWFMDSLLNARIDIVRDFAIELIHRNIKIQWGGFLRANVDQDTAILLKKAGCEFVFVGVESLSDETLELMNKRRTEADNLQAIRSLLAAGIRHVVAGFIPGFPGDTRQRFLRTALVLSQIRREYPVNFRVNVEPFVVSPAQPLFADLPSYGLQAHGWVDDYLDLAPDLRSLTESIPCYVTGLNQGLDRLGELHIARTVTGSARQLSSPDPYLYAEGESLSTTVLELSEVTAGLYLARGKSALGLTFGLILTRDEKEEYEGQLDVLTLNLADADGHSERFVDKTDQDAFLEKIEALHIAHPSRTTATVHSCIYRQDLAAATEVRLSPFAAARTFTLDGVETVVVTDAGTMKHVQVPAVVRPLLTALSAGPLSVIDLGSKFGNTALAFVETCKDLGIVIITGGPRLINAQLSENTVALAH